jgi:hypothetical protein
MFDKEKSLMPDETDLIGEWIKQGTQIVEDRVTARINWLTKHHLEQVAMSNAGAWEILYRDPEDGRYWERTYPHGDWHGGGPPRLRNLSFAEAKEKYKIGN